MVKNQLSALPYLKNNKRRVAVLITSLSLFIALIYLIGFLLSGLYESFKIISIHTPDRLVYIEASDYKGTSTDQKLLDSIPKIKKLKTVDEVFPVGVTHTSISPPLGHCTIEVPLTTKENIPKILDHMGATLIKGRLPKYDGELIMDSNLMKNASHKIGDEMQGGYKIVGIVACDNYLCTGINFELYESSLLILSNTPNTDYTSLTKSLPFPHSVNDGVTGRRIYQKDIVPSIKPTNDILILSTLLMLSLCLIVVINMYIRDRHEEWCLYYSIGYSSQTIYYLALKELLITIGISCLIGAILSIIGVGILYAKLYMNRGLLCRFISSDSLCSIVVSLLFIFSVCQIPIYFSLKKIRTIDVLESED